MPATTTPSGETAEGEDLKWVRRQSAWGEAYARFNPVELETPLSLMRKGFMGEKCWIGMSPIPLIPDRGRARWLNVCLSPTADAHTP